MRYVMKQKVLSWGNDFVIRDENEQEVFLVDNKLFALGNKFSFRDMQKNELAYISEKVLSWGPTYEIYRRGELAAVVKQKLFTLFHCKFNVDVPGPDDLEAEGDFLDYEYTFTRGGVAVAHVTKKWLSWTDTYGVEIAEGEDDVLILASTVVIDMVCHDDHC